MWPGGEPTSRDTECFSMYSDMSTWIIASSSPKRNSARVRASSVLPTPDGPRKMKVPVLDVAVGEHCRCAQRVVRDRAAVVRLVAVAEAAQDLDGVVHRRLVDLDLLEAALEGGVALEVLAVLVEGRRADRLELTAGERGLQDRRRVDRALSRAGADEVMELVDEEDDVPALGDLLHHLLQAF